MADTDRGAKPHDVRTDIPPLGHEYITILALDGGGMRGLLAARVVQSLEMRTRMPACRMFDLIAGTSTGGILALGLAKPGVGPRPEYSATDLVDLYRTHGPAIFRRSLWHALITLGGLAGPKYPAGNVEAVLRRYFGEARVTEALTSVLVTSYDTAAARPYFFKSYRPASAWAFEGAQNFHDYLMWQAARATAAAPTYFPPFRLAPIEQGAADKSLLDGGVFANSPTLCALADAFRMFRAVERPFLVVSVGTGNDQLRLTYDRVKGRGLLRWAVPILNIVFDGVSDAVDYQAAEMADRYYRFQEEAVAEELDDASPDTIQRLLAAADDLIARNDSVLGRLANELRRNVAGATPVFPTRASARP